MTDVSDRAPRAAIAADAASEPLALHDAASRAGCTPAYLAECIGCGQLAADADGRVDARRLTTWMDDCLKPQQRALRAVVDAIDAMEQRSLKPADGVGAVGAEGATAAGAVAAAACLDEPPKSAVHRG